MEAQAVMNPNEAEKKASASSKVVMKRLLMVIFALCLLGVAVSIELTRIHVLAHTDPNHQSVCAVSEGVNCDTVALSPYSVFGYLPVSVWGIFGYVAMAFMAAWSLSRFRLHSTWPLGVLFLLSVSFAVTSVLLAYISFTKIDSICIFCMTSYGINFILLVLCSMAVRRSKPKLARLLLDDLLTATRRPLPFFGAAGCAVFALVSMKLFVKPYWRTPDPINGQKLVHGKEKGVGHWIGAHKPLLTIIEYSDYECPHCRGAHRRMRSLVSKHPDKIRLFHRHLPLDQACNPRVRRPFHRRACQFAEAAECAGRQGKFWEMNDALYSAKEKMHSKRIVLHQIAARLGLDMTAFKQCLSSRATAEDIKRHIHDAISMGLRGTPTFLVGSKKYLGGIPASELERLLQRSSRQASAK